MKVKSQEGQEKIKGRKEKWIILEKDKREDV